MHAASTFLFGVSFLENYLFQRPACKLTQENSAKPFIRGLWQWGFEMQRHPSTESLPLCGISSVHPGSSLLPQTPHCSQGSSPCHCSPNICISICFFGRPCLSTRCCWQRFACCGSASWQLPQLPCRHCRERRARCPQHPASRSATDRTFTSAYFSKDRSKSAHKERVVLGDKQLPKESISSLEHQKGGRFP